MSEIKDHALIRDAVIGKDLIVPELKEGQIGLNLGSGIMYLDGWVNADVSSRKKDIFVNLNKFPYPWEDNSVDYIIMHHIIEHLDHPVKCIFECHRILKVGGKLIVHYPHYSSPIAHLPYHKWTLCRNSFNDGNTPFLEWKPKLLYSQFHRTRLINWWINFLKNYYEKIPLIGCALFPAFEVQVIFTKTEESSYAKIEDMG